MALNTVSSDRLSTNVKNTNFTAAEKQDLTNDILPLSGQLGTRNKVINGGMMIHQRGDASATNSSDYLSSDRFLTNNNSSAQVAVTKSTDTPDGFSASTKWDCTTVDTNVAAGDYFLIQHRMEGQNVQDFEKGTSSAKQYALSFYIKATKTGVYTIELEDTDNQRACSKTITVSDNNWNRYSLIFPADTTGAFNNDANSSLTINFWLMAGSSFTSGTLQTSAWGARTSANRVSSSNVNALDNTSNDFLLTGVQLEVGSVVTEFEHRSFTDELLRCQRYYWQYPFGGEGDKFIYGGAYATSTMIHYSLPTKMRATPTLTFTEKRAGSSSDASYSDQYLLQYQQVGVNNGYLKNPKLNAEL
tara:strand:- start:442 stop:1518 length:1077 start_codon:yes stop_codon:yes gene_type:complete